MAQRKLKPLAKLLIILAVVGALFGILKLTGVWDSLFPSADTKETTVPKIEGLDENAPDGKDSSVPKIEIEKVQALDGTSVLRLAHWTWNSHQAWAYANRGKFTKSDSIFAKNGITMSFNRMEEIPNQIAALVSFANALKSGESNPSAGVHFFTIMGDAAGWVLNDTNKALQPTGYSAEIIGFSGFSSGEDKFMGPPQWRDNPEAAKGGLVAGVAADGDWNIMIFWCAQNSIPFNSDKRYYDPNALNFVQTDSFLQAAELYIAGQPVELIFKEDGVDYQGNPVRKNAPGKVMINGSVTWTPGDINIAEQRGGLVSIASTKEYSNQMPQYIVGLKQWNAANQDLVVRMLASIFEAADLISRSEDGLQQGLIDPKSPISPSSRCRKPRHL